MVSIKLYAADGSSLEGEIQKIAREAMKLAKHKPAGFVVGYVQLRIEAIVKGAGVTVRRSYDQCDGPIFKHFPYHP